MTCVHMSLSGGEGIFQGCLKATRYLAPWKILSQADEQPWMERLEKQLAIWKEANGDPASWGARRCWAQDSCLDPMVLEAPQAATPGFTGGAAGVYGEVFSQAQEQWLTASLEAAREAAHRDSVIPDQDARHATINGAIDRASLGIIFMPAASDSP